SQVYVQSRFLEALPPILILASFGLFAAFYFTFKWNTFSLLVAGIVLAQLFFGIWRKSRKVGPAKQAWQKVQRDFTLYSNPVSEEERLQLVRLSTQPETLRQQGQWKPNRSVGAVMMTLAIAGFGGSFIWGQKRAQFIESAAKAPGKIVSSQSSSDGKSNVYYPVIEFSPQGSRNLIRFKGEFGTSHPGWRVGDPVTVLYDPFNPQKAIMEDGMWMYFFPILIGGLAALFFLIGWANLFTNPNRRKKPPPPGARHPRRAA
ncbi:MAG: DUF3592 domain-containing protein, partial [Bdellovibrionales bacterium]|nr:DUF3592 domain-containing protein [Bdellovibrionales bacterium]